MADGHDKGSAIAICRSSLKASALARRIPNLAEVNLNAEEDRGFRVSWLDSEEGIEGLSADYKGIGRVLLFENAVVARREVNKNLDGLTRDGLKELAATLPLMPIEKDHDPRQVRGVFTKAWVTDWRKKDGTVVPDGELRVSGVIFARNYPEDAQAVANGELKFSIDAQARVVACAACGASVAHRSEVCEHLADNRSRLRNGVVRYFFGLTAKAAGLTRVPAGTDTCFDTEHGLVMVASLYDEEARAMDIEAKWYAPYTEGELDDGDFAWLSDAYKQGKEPKSTGRKLPYKIHGKVSEEGWRAAWARAHQKNTDFSGGPSREEVIEKLKRDKPKGIEIKESLEGGHEMTEAEFIAEKQKLEAQIAQLEAAYRAEKERADRAEAMLQAEKARADAAEAKLVAEKERADKAEASIALAARRAIVLADVLGKQRVQEIVADLATMSESHFNILAEVTQSRAAVRSTGSLLAVGDEGAAREDGRRFTSLSDFFEK